MDTSQADDTSPPGQYPNFEKFPGLLIYRSPVQCFEQDCCSTLETLVGRGMIIAVWLREGLVLKKEGQNVLKASLTLWVTSLLP